MSEVSVFAGTQMRETRSAGRLARLDRASPATKSYQPYPTSRDGSCAARRSEEDVMKQKCQCDFSKRLQLSQRAADNLYIRVITVQALETGYGAQSAMLIWSSAKASEARCAFIPAS